MNPQIEAAKKNFEQTSSNLLKNLAAIPDEKVGWSPSPSSRTPLEIAFHCAGTVAAIQGSMDGENTIPKVTTEQFDKHFREQESKHLTRDEVVKMINENSAAYVAWLSELSEEKFAGTWSSPFGEIPIAVAITIPADHMSKHVSQIEYIQTIYGDRVWH